MLLSDFDINKLYKDYEDLIVPWNDDSLQPASYDLMLGEDLLLVHYNKISPKERKVNGKHSKTIHLLKDEDQHEAQHNSLYTKRFLLKPKQFVLGTTEETVHIPNGIGARFEGKSSLGRIGLMTHVTAGFIDPGFNGNITVEICNISNSYIYLERGMKIGQICFYEMKSKSKRPYGARDNHYQNQSGPTEAYS